MNASRKLKKILVKERDTGSKGGDRQQSHEQGREGSGTRPSGGGGSGGQSGGQQGSKTGGSSGGKGKGH